MSVISRHLHNANANGDDADDEISNKKSSNKNEKRVHRWKKKEPIVFDTSFREKKISTPPKNAAEKHHYSISSYFAMTVSLNILLTTQTYRVFNKVESQ